MPSRSSAVPVPSSGLVLSEHHVVDVAIGVGVLAFVIILLPLGLALAYKRRDSRGANAAPSFFEIPFITWFLVHYGIAALAILAIVFLAVDNVIDKGTVSALLGSLFGYVLGSAAHGSRPAQGGQGTVGPEPRGSGSGAKQSPLDHADDTV